MQDGNILKYTLANPRADRPMLVCVHQLEDRRGELTLSTIARTSVPGSDASSSVRYFTRCSHPGR
jgi:hypothetical protein